MTNGSVTDTGTNRGDLATGGDVPATPLVEARAFWDEPDLFKADTERVAVFPGSNTLASHAETWADATQDEAVGIFIAPLGLTEGARVLDFGCGTGRISRALARAGFDVWGVDIAPSMVGHARGRCEGLRARFSVTDGLGCGDVPDGWADAAVSAFVFQHLPSLEVIEAIVRDIARCLRPGGVVRVQSHRWGVQSAAEARDFHGIQCGPDQLSEIFAQAGLTVLDRLENDGHAALYSMIARKGL